MEEMYKNAHTAIRADPVFHKKPAREGFVPKRYVHISFLEIKVLRAYTSVVIGFIVY